MLILMCKLIPDEKKPVPWGLPPLRSEVLQAQQQQQAEIAACRSSSSSMKSPAVLHRSLAASSAGTNGYYNEKQPFVAAAPATRPRMPGLKSRVTVLTGGLMMITGSMLHIRLAMGNPTARAPSAYSPTTLGADSDTATAVKALLDSGFDTNNTVAWDRLAEMTDLYGHRMTASKAYDRSAEWVLRTVKSQDKKLAAYTEPVWVNEWKRGSESLRLFIPTRPDGYVDLPLLGLGNSVPTPRGGIEAKVIPVTTFESLAQLGNKTIAGNIVLFNSHFTSYGENVKYRSRGALEAQKYGARAALVRTIAPDSSFHTIHTGNSRRAAIPTAAISAADANLIERMYNRAKAGASKDHVLPRVKLVMNNTFRESAKQSANIIIDLKGTEHPDEIVLLSGHFDSWDVGVGAMDDAAGAFLAWEAQRLISKSGRLPRRTIRVVMWNNEETIQRGAVAYYDKHKDEVAKHKFAFESDIGVFEPWGLGVKADQAMVNNMKTWGNDLIKVLGAGNITVSEDPGEDISILCEHGVPCAGILSLNPENNASPLDPNWETHYFRHHHANSDRVEVIDKHRLRRSAAALAAWAYLIADSN
ncbi:hypothetical protein GGI12_004022 [Dipsacomyces acuminosporus]|nr:hypothetical protein GGI12_004022 [Dipsacomyces acuminosporus]